MISDSVVITGLGVISPIGTGKQIFWDALIKGTNGIDVIKAFDVTDSRFKKGGEVRDFDAARYMDKSRIPYLGKGSQMGIAAAKMALEDSGLDLNTINPARAGVIIGTTSGEIQVLENTVKTTLAEGEGAVPPLLYGQYPCNKIPNHISDEFNLNGISINIPTACAAGNYAIGYGADLLRLGELDAAIVGGVDPYSEVAFIGFSRLLSVAPEKCQPFDKNRKGMMVSEGAGILIMERYEDAVKRGAHIYARLSGYGLGCDAHDMTAPHPEGLGGVAAITQALEKARIDKDKIGYISAHGTGTPANDRIETKIIKKVFKDRAYKIPVSSIKSMIGHTMGAASAIEALTGCLILERGIIPPTINYGEKDPECDLDYVPNTARECPSVSAVLSSAFAFGGNDSSIILSKV